jgi:hypothetical protein
MALGDPDTTRHDVLPSADRAVAGGKYNVTTMPSRQGARISALRLKARRAARSYMENYRVQLCS